MFARPSREAAPLLISDAASRVFWSFNLSDTGANDPSRYNATMNSLPDEIETFRDLMWRREPERRVENALDAERLVESAGFCCGDDRRAPTGAVALRRGHGAARRTHAAQRAERPGEQSDVAAERRSDATGARLLREAGARAGDVRRAAPCALFQRTVGLPRRKETEALSPDARATLKVLRREWEMATSDLREAAGISDRARLTRALDELQRRMKVVPAEALYEPWFTYIWTLAEGRFAKELAVKVKREVALREVARAFLDGAGMTLRGELAKVTGLSRPDAGLGNRALVDEGYACARRRRGLPPCRFQQAHAGIKGEMTGEWRGSLAPALRVIGPARRRGF